MVAAEPIVLVSGFGRCGSSLTLQMLAAGGMPVVGVAPAYEPDELCPRQEADNHLDRVWLEKQAGRAMKLLDPHRYVLPSNLLYRPIWLTRDKREQARSQVKFLKMFMGIKVGKGAVQALMGSYSDDKLAAVRSLFAAGPTDILEVHFEELIGPIRLRVAKEIADFVERDLDTEAMARAVISRSPLCQPGLDIEMSLIRAAEGSRG